MAVRIYCGQEATTKMMRANHTTLIFLTASMLAGCMTHRQDPTLIAEARSYSREGNEAYREGDLKTSKQAYGQALKLHHAIDDSAGIIRDLINLAVVSKANGSRSDAIECLDAIDRYVATLHASGSETPRITDLNTLLLEAGWMRAYLDCDAGRPQAARRQLARSTASYGVPDRTMKGRFLNLEARIDLEEGNPAEALSTATRALKANKRMRDPSETADSHRIIGRALIQSGSPDRAQLSFERALEIDREQGRPSKVVDNLIGMAEASRAGGNNQQARASAQRALIAARAAGDSEGESRSLHLINKL